MLQIKNLTITHKKDLRTIVESFQLVLNDGDKAVMIGEEGNGKSTIMKWIFNPALIEVYSDAAGERILNKERMGYLPQELPPKDREKTLYEFFTEEPMFFEQSPKQLGELAKQFRIPVEFFYSEQRMGTLSGGEKIKAQMMRLFLSEPTILLLDEPSNDIDLKTLEWLEEAINRWPQVVLFISHDETLIERTANVVIHLEQIRRKTVSQYSVHKMSYREYMAQRQEKFVRQEQQALNERREKRLRDEKLKRVMQSVDYKQANLAKSGRDAAGKRLKDKMHTVKSMERRFERENTDMTEIPEEEQAIFFRLGDKNARIPAGKTVLEYSLDCLKTPDNERILAKDIFLRVRGPQKVCLIGENGAGKTTLLKKIAEELLNREDICAAYMPQNYEELLELEQTPVDYLDASGEKEERTRIRTFLGSLKYTTDEMDHPIAELSGGQKAKILLLKMSMSGADVLILDEPTRNFSPLSGPVIRQMLSQFPGAIISISHDRKYIGEVCSQVYQLSAEGLEIIR